MLRAVAGTHAIIWYLYDDPRLLQRAGIMIEEAARAGDQIGVSAITLAETVPPVDRGNRLVIRPSAGHG